LNDEPISFSALRGKLKNEKGINAPLVGVSPGDLSWIPGTARTYLEQAYKPYNVVDIPHSLPSLSTSGH
jgi:hypothetical protein